jgi:tripartite-type tricarboxylate transporter receptor subunit TctC
MKKLSRWFLVGLLSVLFTTGVGSMEVGAQDKYPSRAIDIICPFAAGGSTDLITRVTAAYLNKKWGVPVNVVNKPGGNTVPACLEVYQAKPDGYTLLADGNPSSSMVGIVIKTLPFKIMDRTFLGVVGQTAHVPIVAVSSPFKSLKDLEAEAKKSPKSFTWTSLGGASLQDYVIRQFLKAIGVDVKETKPVMSQGGSQAVTLTAGGHVTMGTATASSALPAIQGNMVRPLAITSSKRWPDLPDVATTAELGYPTITGVQWNGISGPSNLPAPVIEKWNKGLQEMLKDPDAISKLKNVGASPFFHDAHQFRELVLKETEEVAILWGLK